MLKRLEVNALRADLASVSAMLESRTDANDPLGRLQFQQRQHDIQRRLQEVETSHSTAAAVGIFFGGRPVIGSHGILAEFGSKAVGQFQQLLTTLSASIEGPIGSRGPVRQRERAQMLLTNVARGSFGFVLEQVEGEQLIDGPMKALVAETVDMIYRVASSDEEAFEHISDDIDVRVLGDIRAFFRLLSDAGATMRLVEGDREISLAREDVDRGYERTESLSVSDETEELEGKLYLLPQSKRFDLRLPDGETITGAVLDQALNPLLDIDGDIVDGVIGGNSLVIVRKREIQSHARVLRRSYVLTALLRQGRE